MTDTAKDKLVHFLEKRAFEPVLKATPEHRSEAERKKLETLQQKTDAEIERFRNYRSAHDVVVNFKRDLSSSKAKEVHRGLKSLHLPTIEDVREDFEKLASELGIDA